MGLYSYKETNCYIFSENEYNKIYSFKDEINLGTRMYFNSYYYGKKKKHQKQMLDRIQTTIESDLSRSGFDKTYNNEFTFIFPVKKIQLKDEVVIRFLIPVESFYIEKREYSKPKYNFEKEYFEISLYEFEKLIIK